MCECLYKIQCAYVCVCVCEKEVERGIKITEKISKECAIA
jgi:hypothetical protein